ncbi:HD family phosphohydrolase [uncultured Clostridium sp.]|uniref:HD family phosphohydrolase n=1 Tax=uncultured Clostridium sp. TaxID=59620 RepID=UPI0028EEE6ED|nr:HD family phosphohydrolase [uncultured Clostridium sp.]
MINWIIEKLEVKHNSQIELEYLECIRDLVANEEVISMKNYIQHKQTDCLEHCLYVSYYSYLICKKFGFDWRAAARGGLLHDFFLYDWHKKDRENRKRWHGFTHPKIALCNAKSYFNINDIEQDIIYKHMWPLTLSLPLYKESYIIVFIDKYCALMESCNLGRRDNIKRLQRLIIT